MVQDFIMHYNLNTHTEKVFSLQGKEYFVPSALSDDIRKMVERIDTNKPLGKQWNHIVHVLLGGMNASVPVLNEAGVREFISLINSY